ncbi:1-phosphatidylinositol-3-phosphate 5-kinase fab1b [Datura stramonium]|uniref:1-phosphatidylinositol-3-phosphate 5-kinase fab1b n=1 Tax=Datura stramonium TaxID=4076 RepID=A0ABS8TPL0_DATST|nr:1-phosphatidylinositol-3-phosphate 5-kinase fab1b [Datura stramonium]
MDVLVMENLLFGRNLTRLYDLKGSSRSRYNPDSSGSNKSVDVMDYSLLVGVDEEKHELVLGIIDFMRQYTWDKHLETWVKASGILGGPKNVAPTERTVKMKNLLSEIPLL